VDCGLRNVLIINGFRNPQSAIHIPAVSHLEKGDTMGERMGRIGQIETDFLDPNTRISSKKIKKNPFGSARSAPSVLPSYLPFPNEKLLSTFRNPQSAIHNPQSAIHNPQSAIHNPQSAIHNPQSAIHNPQSAIHNPHSEI
jgi:hypothetical protein